jgi:hypothetical protein
MVYIITKSAIYCIQYTREQEPVQTESIFALEPKYIITENLMFFFTYSCQAGTHCTLHVPPTSKMLMNLIYKILQFNFWGIFTCIGTCKSPENS